MGASTSAQRDDNSQKDATTAEEQNAEANEIEQGGNFDPKLLQKSGQISGLNGKADDQTGGFDSRSGEKIQTEVSQTDFMLVSQKDDILEVMEVLQDEATPQPNIETPEKESASTNSVTPTEKKATKEEPGEAGEVGFTKIFRFVGFKFTLKKDKSGKATPEPLLPGKKEEGGEVGCSEGTQDAEVQEEPDHGDTAPEPATAIRASDEVDEDIFGQAPEKTEKEITLETESPHSPVAQEIQSPIKKFFTQGFFSTLRKRKSFKKSTEDVLLKEKATEVLTEENAKSLIEEGEKGIENTPSGPKKEQTTPEEPKAEPATERTLVAEGGGNEGEIDFKADAFPTAPEEETMTLPADTPNDKNITQEEAEDKVERQISTNEILTVLTTEVDLLSSQEKAKVHGSPLKKLFAGAGLKKRSKKLKAKREVETKLTESGEHATEQLNSSTESGEDQRVESSFSSPEESVEHINGEPLQGETEGDRGTSDEERRRDGIQPWSSFKKLMTPKKRVKRSSESEDEAAEKPKSATLSLTDSAVFTEQLEESKLSDEEQKIELRMEEPSKKKESSMPWEALLCGGSAKKRAKKTLDSDEEEVEEDEQPGRTMESPLGSSQDGDHELLTSSPDQAWSPSEGDGGYTWASLKRLVTPRRRAKGEHRTEDPTGFSEQVPSDSEIPKEDTSFSLKRLIPGRRKKKQDGKQEQVSSDEVEKDFGLAEEDSDTPAVVPLSEFDLTEPDDVRVIPKEEAAEKQINTTATEEAKPEMSIPEPEDTVPQEALPITGEKAQDAPPITGTEEQSASWIPITAELETEEKTECITKHQQLSDIPEEGAIEDTTTPKSTAEEVFQDDTIAEDIVELTSEAVTALEQAPEESLAEESTEMVSAVSQLTDSPGTSGDTTPVPVEYEMKQTEMVLQEAVETISLAVDVLSATKGVEHALLAHAMSEATTICIDLDSQEIEPVWEDLVKFSVEGIPEVSEAISSEIVSEAKKDTFEGARIAQNEVYEAQVQVVKTEDFQEKVEEKIPQDVEAEAEQVSEVEKEFPTENAIHKVFEVMQLEGEVKETQEAESMNEQQEPRPVQITLNAEQGEVELLEGQVVIEGIPMSETEMLIETVVDESICSQSAQVTEMLIVEGEKEQEQEDIDKYKANVEHAPVTEVFRCLKEEFTASMSELPTAEASEGKEAFIKVQTFKFTVAEEAVGIVDPPTEPVPSEMAEITNEVGMERVSEQFSNSHGIQFWVEDAEFQSAESTIEAEIEAALTDTCIVEEGICERVEEEQEVMIVEQVTKAALVEEQSSVTVWEIIENVVESLPEITNVPQAAEAHKEEEIDTSIPENSFQASDLKEPEAVSVIDDEAEKVPKDITGPGTPLDADTQIEVQSPTEEEAKDAPTQSVAAETEESKNKSSSGEVLKEAEIAAVTEKLVSQVPEDNHIAENVPMRATESLDKASEHHQDAALEAQSGKNQELDEETKEVEEKFQDDQEEKDGKETVEKVALEKGRRETRGYVESQPEPEMGAEEVDQSQVDYESCSQEERGVNVELQHQDKSLSPPDSQDTEIILSNKKEQDAKDQQEAVEEVSLDVPVPGVLCQMEDMKDLLSQTGVTEESLHLEEITDECAEQIESLKSQTVDSEISKHLTGTKEPTTEKCSQNEEEVRSQVMVTNTQSQVPQAETCAQGVEITEERCQIVKEAHFKTAADSLTQAAAESNKDGDEVVIKSFVSQEREADITQIPVEEPEQTSVSTNIEAVSETVKREYAQSQEHFSEEVIDQEIATGDSSSQDVGVKDQLIENIYTWTPGDGQAGAIPIEVKEQTSVTEDIADNFMEDKEAVELMAQIETDEAIEELMSKMEPNCAALTAAS